MEEKEEYRKQIIEMIEKMKNNDMLQFVYIVVSDLEGIADSKRE